MTSIGFTGTRRGMSRDQKRAVTALLRRLSPDEAHHGICIGADEDFHNVVRSLFGEDVTIIGHPGVNNRRESPTRATLAERDCDFVLPEKFYLVRDDDIADSGVDGLIACPYSALEERRSGTWATVRKARKRGRKVYLVMPSGDIDEEENG